MKTIRVNVDQGHILNGQPQKEKFCAIALALKAQTGSDNVHVEDFCAFVEDVQYELPEEAQRFLKAFDSKEPVAPLLFEMKEYVEPPCSWCGKRPCECVD